MGQLRLDWTCPGKILCTSHQLTSWSIENFIVMACSQLIHLRVNNSHPMPHFSLSLGEMQTFWCESRQPLRLPQGLSSACSYLLLQPCSCPTWQSIERCGWVWSLRFGFVLGFIACRCWLPVPLYPNGRCRNHMGVAYFSCYKFLAPHCKILSYKCMVTTTVSRFIELVGSMIKYLILFCINSSCLNQNVIAKTFWLLYSCPHQLV